MKLKTFLIKDLGPYCGYIYIVAANDKTEAKKICEENYGSDVDNNFSIQEIPNTFVEGTPDVILSENVYSY